ncbi:MAG: hypothetical protein HKN82_07280 [Akkermansiaceae bacterium]|nr:hypothetical protein [Akkermansiaceae bacterium]
MKATKLNLAVGLAAYASLLAGSALAQDTSNVVGYEKLSFESGFNYLGQRLVGSGNISTTVTNVAGTTVTLAADSGLAGDRSIFEVSSGTANGTVTGSSVTGATVTTDDDLSAELANGDSVTVREIATLASVFGAANEAGLSAGFFGPGGADQILLPDGSGGFTQYYYDDFDGWHLNNGGTNPGVDPATIEMVYTDGFLINGNAAGCVTITGDVKTGDTAYALTAQFNPLSSIYPAGATLETSFGATNDAGLDAGFFGPGGADQILVPVTGGFEQYYYDDFDGWHLNNGGTNPGVDPTTVALPSGILIQNVGAAQNVTVTAPDFYANL